MNPHFMGVRAISTFELYRHSLEIKKTEQEGAMTVMLLFNVDGAFTLQPPSSTTGLSRV